METLKIQPQNLLYPTHIMYSISARLRPKLFHTGFQLRALCSSCLNLSNTHELIHAPPTTKKAVLRDGVRVRVKVSDAQLKENWLASLSCPFPTEKAGMSVINGDTMPCSVGTEWVIGIDPDLSGALAVLKTDDSGCTPQVFDTPHLQVLVGRRIRRRLDANSIVRLLRSFDAPIGTIAYIEQSIPYPQDGKQGWWSGGFNYGLWVGILVASGFSVVPVPSSIWKNEFELAGNRSNKDDSRRVASTLFPSTSSLLRRKKDHGRAEALLIAAYGKGLKANSQLCISAESVP